MRIKFVAPDPRAGLTAQMDSHRGQQLVDAGAAVRINEDGTEIAGAPADPPASLPRPEGLGPDATGEQLRAAYEAAPAAGGAAEAVPAHADANKSAGKKAKAKK